MRQRQLRLGSRYGQLPLYITTLVNHLFGLIKEPRTLVGRKLSRAEHARCKPRRSVSAHGWVIDYRGVHSANTDTDTAAHGRSTRFITSLWPTSMRRLGARHDQKQSSHGLSPRPPLPTRLALSCWLVSSSGLRASHAARLPRLSPPVLPSRSHGDSPTSRPPPCLPGCCRPPMDHTRCL